MNASGAPLPAAGVENPWVLNVLRPVGLTLMAGCVVLPIAQVLTFLAPGLHVWLLAAAGILTALEVSYTHRLIRTHRIFSPDMLRTRAIEIALYFLVLKAIGLVLYGFPPGPINGWLLSLFWWLDAETLISLGLAVVCALAVDSALQDFDRIGETAEFGRDYVSAIDSLTGHFFIGGAVLLVFSGLSQVGIDQLLSVDRPPVSGLIGNVLVYFLAGLVLLSQVRLELLAVRWQAQGVRTPPDLTRRWVRYTATFVGLCALVAFVLPTGYTQGTLGLLGGLLSYALTVIWVVLFALLTLMFLPLRWLLSLLKGETPPPSDTPAPLTPPPPDLTSLANKPLPPWADTLRTIAIILVVAGFAAYIIWSWLRERPELVNSFKNLAALRGMRRLWAVLRHRVSGLLASARDSAPLEWLRERLRRAAPAGAFNYFRLGGASPREQVLFYYLSLLRRAGEQGFGRRPPQSPRDYQPVLSEQLPTAAPELQELTAAFEETRYSAHPVTPEDAARTRALWQRVRAALTRKKRDG